MKAKSNSSLNAVKHSAYSRALLLPWESADELVDLYTGLCNDLNPDGVLESEMLQEILSLIWQRRRAMWAIQLVYYRTPVSRQIRRSGKKTPGGVQRHLENRAKLQEKISSVFEGKWRSVARKMRILARELESNGKRDTAQAIEDILAVQEGLKPIAKELASMNKEVKIFKQAYDYRRIGRLFTLESSIAARLEKTIARYFAVREYRRASLPKLIGSTSSAALPRRARDEGDSSPKPALRRTSQHSHDNWDDQDNEEEEFDWEHEYEDYKSAKRTGE